MKDMNISDVICWRQLELKDGRKVNAYIWKPFMVSEFEYTCKYSIIGLEKDVERVTRGVDSFQVIIFSIEMICMYLRDSNYAKLKEMSWFDNDEDFGFSLSLSDGN